MSVKDKKGKPPEDGGSDDEYPTEFTSGDRDPFAGDPCIPETCFGDCQVCQGGGDREGLAPCVKGTCKSTGGTIVCEVCPCAGEVGAKESRSAPEIGGKHRFLQKGTASDHILEKPKKVYKPPQIRMDLLYPGIHVGHRDCIAPGRKVPAKMGWMWDIHVPCFGLKVGQSFHF